MDYIVHGVAKSWTQLSDFHFLMLQCQESSLGFPSGSEFLTFNTVDVLEQIILCCGGSFVHCSVLRSTPRFHPPNGSILPLTPLVMFNHVFRCWLRFQRGQIPPLSQVVTIKLYFQTLPNVPGVGESKIHTTHPPPPASGKPLLLVTLAQQEFLFFMQVDWNQ